MENVEAIIRMLLGIRPDEVKVYSAYDRVELREGLMKFEFTLHGHDLVVWIYPLFKNDLEELVWQLLDKDALKKSAETVLNSYFRIPIKVSTSAHGIGFMIPLPEIMDKVVHEVENEVKVAYKVLRNIVNMTADEVRAYRVAMEIKE